MADNSDKIALLSDLLQKGQITQDMFDTNVAKLKTLSQNIRPEMPARASSLSDVMAAIKDRGAGIQNIANDVKEALPGMAALNGRTSAIDKGIDIAESIPKMAGTSLDRLNAPTISKFGKTMKMLGVAAPIMAAASIGSKAMAGDYGGAGTDAVDTATDYVPVLGEIKQAIRPTEMGDSELPADVMAARQIYNDQARRGKGMDSPQAIDNLEDPARLADLQKPTSRFNLLNKMKDQ